MVEPSEEGRAYEYRRKMNARAANQKRREAALRGSKSARNRVTAAWSALRPDPGWVAPKGAMDDVV